MFSADPDRWAQPFTRFVTSASADRDGQFQIEGLPPGTYLAAVSDSRERSQWRDPDFLELAAKAATRFNLKSGAETTIELRRQ